MKIKVDGDFITIECTGECKKFCEGIIDENMSQGQEREQKVQKTTYRDLFLKFCKEVFEKKFGDFSKHDSESYVSWADEKPYFIGFEINWALNQFAAKFDKSLDWTKLEDIADWLDSEVVIHEIQRL